jgi:cation diffusion facilitator family transporter
MFSTVIAVSPRLNSYKSRCANKYRCQGGPWSSILHQFGDAVTLDNLHAQLREKKLVAASSVGAAIFLTATKLVIGIWTGSLGIQAEAAHSALDLAAAILTYFAVRVSARPADESHLYGHAKVENLSALAETVLLLVTCIWIIHEAIVRLLFRNVAVDASLWAFLTMALSIAVDFSRSRALSRVARKYESQALEADALHFSTDIWSSAVVIIGLGLVRYGDFAGKKWIFVHADAMAALVVAAIVIVVSMRLGRKAIDVLLDTAPRGLAESFATAMKNTPGVRRVSGLRVRNVGTQIFVDATLEVPRHHSFEESHAVAQQARDAVRAVNANADVVLRTVPTSENEGVLERIQSVAAREHLAIHNVTTHWTKSGIWIDLDLEVEPELSFDRAHSLASTLEGELRKNLAEASGIRAIADINVHIEPRAETMLVGQEIPSSESAQFLKRIKAIQRSLEYTRGCKDIDLHEMNGKLYLSLHLSIDADRTIASVHDIAEQMENRLRREIPRLGRVVIHTEPSG